jgi:hypothetical protein
MKYRFFANNCAVAPGITRSAEMRMMPTIFMDMTIPKGRVKKGY